MSNKGLFNLAKNVAPQAIQVKTEIRDITGNLIENIGDLKPSDPDFFYKSFKNRKFRRNIKQFERYWFRDQI